jgi:hypothetical protein
VSGQVLDVFEGDALVEHVCDDRDTERVRREASGSDACFRRRFIMRQISFTWMALAASWPVLPIAARNSGVSFGAS